MFDFKTFRQGFEAEHAATWQRIYEHNQGIIKIRRMKAVLPNLEKIVLATLQISNRSSFHSMSLRDLSREAGISMGALYSYIESKEQLLAMILGHVLFLVDTVLTPPAEVADAPAERLRWLLRAHVYLSEAMQPWFFFAYMEAKTFDRRGREMAFGNELRTERMIAECLVAGQAAGTFKAADPAMIAALTKPLLQDWYLKRWKYRRRNINPDAYAGWVIHFLEAVLGVPD